MAKILCQVILLLAIFSLTQCQGHGPSPKYDPNWESIDSRPLPSWYDEGKIGIFIHWGVFSVPSYINEWFWWSWKSDGSEAHDAYVKDNYPPGFAYEEFAPGLTAEFYDASQWAAIFSGSGASYVVLTSKHHEGYAMWPSSHHFAWNVGAVGPKRDLLGELEQAIRAETDLHFGIYYSLLEWFNPYYVEDMAANWTTDQLPRLKSIPALKELINLYKPDVIWSDGEWEAPDTYWGAVEFLAWLYNESPVADSVVVNDRWGSDTRGKHGGFYNFDDRYNPGVLIPHKWENAMTIDKRAWTYRREATIADFMTPEEVIAEIVVTVACGGNILVNVGPTKEGTIPVILQERLSQMGEWLGVNGEAIYASVPWTYQNDSCLPRYTTSATTVNITTSWPLDSIMHLGRVEASPGLTVGLLGSPTGNLEWVDASPNGISVRLPPIHTNLSKWAWTLVINNLS